ncbi:MAG: type II secretion system protein [Angustibacter sp.]
MLARIRKAAEDKDSGFTLIELLVVMIIIGILAAIAIPVFLNQRKKAVDSSARSDIRSVANEMETYFTDTQVYVAPTTTTANNVTTVTVGSSPVKLSANNAVAAVLLTEAGAVTTTPATVAGFCLTVTNPKGDKAVAGIRYNSLTGGLTETACPA